MEFALIAPVFFVAFFGIIEFSFIMTTLTGFNFAAREGARWGSIIGNTEPNPTGDQDIIQAIVSRSQNLPFGTPQSIDIYKANQDGTCVGGAIGTSACTEDMYLCASSSVCNNEQISNWDPTTRNDTLIGADYLGVRVVYYYTFITSFLNYYCDPKQGPCPPGNAGTHLNLSATSVQRIEPQDFGSDVPSRAPIAAGAAPWHAVAEWCWPALAWWEGAAA